MRGRIPLLRDLPREVTVLSSIAFCVALGFGILIPAIPIFAKSFGVSALAASAVISVFALVRFITSPLAGMLTDRIGERTTLASGLIIVAVSSALAGFAQDYLQLIVLRAVGGLGSSMFTVSAQALLLRVVDAPLRGRASAAFQGGFLFGGVAGPAVGGLVIAWSIRAPFFVYAATLAIATVITLVFLSSRRLSAAAAPGSAGDDGPTGWSELRAALGNGGYRAALGVNLTTGLVTFGMRTAIIPIFVIEGLRQAPSLSGWAFLVAAGVQAVLLLPAGRSADLRGRRPAMIWGTALTVAGMGVLTASDVLANDPGAPLAPAVTAFIVSMAVLGAGTAFLGSAPAAVVGDVMGGRRGGIVIATYQMVSDAGAVIGPLLAGLLVDLFDFDWAFAAGAAISVIALLLALAMPETLRRSSGRPAATDAPAQ
jgi:MFS family permease